MIRKNRMKLCLNYRLQGIVKPSLIFLAIFLFVDLVIPAVLFILFDRQVFGSGGQITMNYGGMPVSYSFLLSSMIFLFVGAIASFRENFHFLLTLNNTRRNQYLSELLLMAIASLLYLICAMVVRFLENILEAFVNRESIAAQFQAFFASAGQHLGESAAALLLTLAIFLCAYALGLAAGALSYRFGRYFLIPFWVCFGASFVFVPIFITSYTWALNLAMWFIGHGRPMPSLSFAVHLLFTAVVLSAVGGLIIRKLPQNS
jgi:hypothetical protein